MDWVILAFAILLLVICYSAFKRRDGLALGGAIAVALVAGAVCLFHN